MTGQRRLRVGCEFEYDVAYPTPTVWQVEPLGDGPATVVSSAWTTDPQLSLRHYTDLYGNSCRRVTLPQGDCTVRFEASVVVPDAVEAVDLDAPEVPVADLPDDALLFTLPSRYVLNDVLGDEAWRLFGDTAPGYRRVKAICDFVNGHLRFQYGSSTPLTTAADVYGAGVGVCRDFTHLGITFCRALNIPARYVFGYLPDMDIEPLDEPMDFAAWMEVYLGGQWWTFDPRNNVTRKGRVVIGRGRDAGDVAMVTAFGGPALKRMDVIADEVREAAG
jgi:transglutaminase-like putative cysteine protease